ncbi:hypothetical protein VTO73DRAFT_15542 [Trametes versicolor]
MLEVATSFFDGLQYVDPPESEEQHGLDIEEVAARLETSLPNQIKADLTKRIKSYEIEQAIDEAASGKAPGLDGIPTEVWKTYQAWYRRDVKAGKPAFNIAQAMCAVYNDIEKHGIDENTRFAEGWICPIYKKKDPRIIGNYRPITLLNTDYKIFTRALTMRLTPAAEHLVHPDQAGFLPGRKILDHVRLAELAIDYAEAEEFEGAIVALDQEKAYDRVDHQYLWAVLRKLNIPENFIRTVQHLYQNAESAVMLNGTLGRRFKIVRGVRQGDPLSCLLFNLAIEPLATALRKSTLKGMEVPGGTGRLITKLFADDTTVYLSAHDDYNELLAILTKWCAASRAKFNKEKTEILPIGPEQYRSRVVRTRKLTSEAQALPTDVRITPDGQAIRILGAWVGNGACEEMAWEPVLDKIQKNLKRWQLRRPTLYGKKLIIGMEVAGRTQFLTAAQGMPPKILDRLNKMIADFVWDEAKHPPIKRETLHAPVQKGGLGMLNLSARNEAIQLMTMKSYLDISPARPQWAFLADTLFAKAASAGLENQHPRGHGAARQSEKSS